MNIFGWGFAPRSIKYGYPTHSWKFLCQHRREMGVGALDNWEIGAYMHILGRLFM